MQIHWMEFENYTTGQKIERIEFERLNLLVGESGAGKTQILNALWRYIDIGVFNKRTIPFSGRFCMNFSVDLWENADFISPSDRFTWEVITKHTTDFDGVAREVIDKNGQEIVWKDENRILLNGKEVPELSTEASVLTLFQRPHELKVIRQNFLEFIPYAQLGFKKETAQSIASYRDGYKKKQYVDIKKYITRFSTLVKLDLMKFFHENLYSEFLTDVQEIFPEIENIMVDTDLSSGIYTLFIQQNGKKISMENISSGMLKVIYIISNIDFSPNGTVVTIDELENALGVNCLDDITDFISTKAAEETHQFILTSHHPYIINQIPEEDWRIISQKDGVISSKRAKEVDINTSWNRQEKFFQLMNYMMRQSR